MEERWHGSGHDDGRDIVPGADSGSPSGLTVVDGALYFSAYDPAYGVELWKSNGTQAGTAPLKDIVAGSGGSMPRYLTAVGPDLYFSANDGVHGEELWRSNGTGAGTVMVQDIVPGAGNSDPIKLTAVTDSFGSGCYFVARSNFGLGLWRSGTLSGTTLAGVVSENSPPDRFAAAGNRLYFVYDNGRRRHGVFHGIGRHAGQ